MFALLKAAIKTKRYHKEGKKYHLEVCNLHRNESKRHGNNNCRRLLWPIASSINRVLIFLTALLNMEN